VGKYFHECNYLQANEGNIDLSHLSFLHYLHRTPEETQNEFRHRGQAPEVEQADAVITDHGVRSVKFRREGEPDRYHLYITDFVLPNFTAHWGNIGSGRLGYSVNWHVPIDDTHHWKYMFSFRRDQPLESSQQRRWRPPDELADFKFIRNSSNRYLQDRSAMASNVYTGLGYSFPLHDCWATEGQGAVQDRTKEHPVSMDRAIVVSRKVLSGAIKAVQEGRDPPNVVRDTQFNRFFILATDEVLPASQDWRDYCKELEALVKTAGDWPDENPVASEWEKTVEGAKREKARQQSLNEGLKLAGKE
jgi:hypothetical protein